MDNISNKLQETRDAIARRTRGHLDRESLLNDLGVQLDDAFSRTGTLAYLEEAIQVARESVDSTSEQMYWCLPTRLSNLANSLHSRFQKTADKRNLEEAIQVSKRAVKLLSNDSISYPGVVLNLAIQLRERYESERMPADLEEAIGITQETIRSIQSTHPDHYELSHLLAGLLNLRYARKGHVRDLEQSILIAQELVRTARNPTDQGRGMYLLATLYHTRHMRTGSIEDLDEAIRLGDQAVNIDTENQTLWDDVAGFLHTRFHATGAMAHLEEAIDLSREVAAKTPEDHPHKDKFLINLARQLRSLFSRSNNKENIDECVRLGRQAVALSSKNGTRRPEILTALSVSLNERYLHLEAASDLDEAIQLGKDALTLTTDDDPARTGRLNNLGMALQIRYIVEEKVNVKDIDEVIDLMRQAVQMVSDDAPDRASFLMNLGTCLAHRYQVTESTKDLVEAISCLRYALLQPESPPLQRVLAGREAVRYCAWLSDWPQANDISETAIGIFPRLTGRSLQNTDKQHILGQISGFASDAASVALHLGKGPQAALNFIELGRVTLATSLEELRMDVAKLETEHVDLAQEFIRLRNELELPTVDDGFKLSWKARLSWQELANRRHNAGKSIDELISKVRKKPGYENFFLPPSAEELRNAAKNGPIVVIVASEHRCDAIIVQQSGIDHLPLPLLHSKDAERKAQRGDTKSHQVLKWLWDTITGPILDHLGFTGPPPNGDEWPHVWWIPTGALSRFPIHAAGYHSKGSVNTVLDRVLSSYSLSIKTIIYGRRRQASSSTTASALLVAMQHTPGEGMLPSAAEEIEMVRKLCPSMGLSTVEPKRCKEDIIAHLQGCRIFHFAGHCSTHPENPLQSYLLLEDWRTNKFTVGNLLETNVRGSLPFMAYLSACGTGQITEGKHIDEGIHMISAFQLAGFRHAIGSLWDVNDKVCKDIAKLTYEGIRDCGGLTDHSVCSGLHKATRELRDRWLIDLERIGFEDRSHTGLNTEENSTRSVDSQGIRCVVVAEDMDEDMRQIDWAPYVHFGV